MVDPVRHTLLLYKLNDATQDLGGTAGVAAAISWSAREPSGPPPDGFTATLATGEVGFNVAGRFLVLVNGGITVATGPTNLIIELQRKPKGGTFNAVDKGQRSQLNIVANSYRQISLSTLIKVTAGDTWRLVMYGSADGPDLAGFNAMQMSIVGMGQVNP